jgi:hypothetical protein
LSVEKVQPHNQLSTFIIPRDQWLSQWGLGQGTHESSFLSPAKEAPKKVPRALNPINRMEISNQFPHQSIIVLI